MKIVGAMIGVHDNGFALIEDDKIIACYSEERFSRIKSCFNQNSFPSNSLEAFQKDFNIDIKDPNIELVASKILNVDLPEVQDILNHRSIKLYGHHYSHACGAYYTSGFDENTLIISYDGSDCGDDNFKEINKYNLSKYQKFKPFIWAYGVFYTVKDNKLVEIGNRLRHGGLANFWFSFCQIFGLVGLKDEGKIMGLAAQGEYDEKIYNQLKYFVDNDICLNQSLIENYYINLLSKLNTIEQLILKRKLAYNLQLITENAVLDLVSNLNKKYGPFKNLCVAGGLFANVKLNQKLNEKLSFENVWVYPAMSDEGLSLGSAIAHGVELGVFTNRKIKNVFFGKKYTETEINNSLNNYVINNYGELIQQSLDLDIVADLLVEGKVIGIFDGASEYGPRALGNRSIIVEPTKKETHEYINKRLKRDEIMPFAPIIMEKYIDDICYYDKSKHTSEFMTMCYNVKEEWLDKIPAVINIYDGTARPQVVNKDNFLFHSVLTKFYDRTRIPVLMNTSFNGHGEPIINSPEDALNHLSENTIDYLIIGDKLCNIQFNYFDLYFRENGTLYLLFKFPSNKNSTYQLIVQDEKQEICYTYDIENFRWYSLSFFKIKYDLILLEFDGEKTKILTRRKFNKANHSFYINLKSDRNSDIEIWTEYLKMIETTLDIKLHVVINEESPSNYIDYIEISRDLYDIYLRGSYISLTDDYSSLTIIKSLFDIL